MAAGAPLLPSLFLLLISLILFSLAEPGNKESVYAKRDDMMGFGDISAIDTLGGIGLGKRSGHPFDERTYNRLLSRYAAYLRRP